MPRKKQINTASGSPEKEPERGIRGTPEEVVPKDEKALVDKWLKAIKARLDCKDFKRFHTLIPQWRQYAAGRQYTETDERADKQKLVRANLIYSTMVNALPQIYAKNPEIDVSPTESVEPTRYEAIKKLCTTFSIVLNNQFAPSQANIKNKAKMNIMATQTTAWGILKVLYQRDIDKDPIILQRINDTQDNIKHIEALVKSIENVEEISEHEAKREELKQQLITLEGKVEVVRAEGLVIDRVLSENLVVSENIKEPGAYREADWMAERIFGNAEWAKEMFGFSPQKATTYSKNSGGGYQQTTTTKDENELCIWELWHKKTNTIFTLCEGYSGYMREPYSPPKLGERWYPYFILVFNPLDGMLHPLSDIELLQELQDEYNETRTNLREHRRWSIPHWIGLKGSVKVKDAKAIRDADPFEIVLIEGEPGRPLRDYLEVFENPPILPALYDTAPIRVDWELVSGQPDAARGVVAKAKTLGEADYLQQGMATRMNERIDTNEDLLQDIAQYSAEILLQELTEEQVLRIAGPGAQWPQLTKDEIFDMVQIRIRAGSTGKPDKRMEQEVWMKFLPMLGDAIAQVHEFRKNNDTASADSLIKLMQETMRRFDERMDVNSFFPEQEEGEVDPQKLAMLQQQQEGAKKQLELLSAQIMKLKTEGLKNIAQAEAAELGTQIDGYLRLIEIMQQGLVNSAAQETATNESPTTIQ